jgi:hypothetical protein
MEKIRLVIFLFDITCCIRLYITVSEAVTVVSELFGVFVCAIVRCIKQKDDIATKKYGKIERKTPEKY